MKDSFRLKDHKRRKELKEREGRDYSHLGTEEANERWYEEFKRDNPEPTGEQIIELTKETARRRRAFK